MSWIIRLQRLPLSANAADIRSFFAGLRIPDGAVHIVGGPEGDAFIGFATDEDARQAMRYNDRRIHDQRVRLLLSSRVEMEAVIAKARAGDLGGLSAPSSVASPRRDEPQISSSRPPTCSAPSDSYGLQRGAQPLMAQASSSAFPVRSSSHMSQTGGGDVSHQTDYPQPEYNRGEAMWGRTETQSDSWKSTATSSSYDPRGSTRQPQSSHPSIAPWQDSKMLNVLAQNATAVPAGNALPVYQQSARDERYGSYDAESNFQGYKASVQPAVTSASPAYAQHSQNAMASVDSSRIVQAQSKSDVPVASVYQQGGLVPPLLPGQPLQMPPSIPGLVLPPIVPSALPAVSAAAPVLVTQSATAAATVAAAANPFAAVFPPQNAPIFPPVPIQRTQLENKDDCYVELSRLPPDLLRPAALEQFLRPSVPLTLSSVKVIFDPKGFPLHSLVRFESSKDAGNIIRRDGEQGIRIRASTREAFDTAVDGGVQVPQSNNYSHERARSRNRDSSRSDQPSLTSRRHHSSERRDVDSRRDDRDHRGSRSSRGRDERSPHRTRRRPSRSPPPRDYRDVKRRREDPERYCVEFTNLPFRVTEAEIRNFLGPRCEPVKVSRAFKEDGQASDRWIVEFHSMDHAERAYRTRGSIQDRTVRARRLTNEEADALLSIPDRFGLQKKEEFERKHGSSGEPAITVDGMSAAAAPSYDNFNAFAARQDQSTGPSGPPRRENFSGSAAPSQEAPPPLVGRNENFNAFSSAPTSFRGRGRGRGSSRPFGAGMEHDGPPNRGGPPQITNGPAGAPGFTLNGPSNLGGRFAGPRHPLLQGGPRPPLIPPPSFFGATPASTIRQRGPPSQSHAGGQGSRPTGPPHPLNGPGPTATASTSQNGNGHSNFPAATLPPSAKSCILLLNVPTTSTDSDLARFLGINATRVNPSTVRRLADGKVYVDLGSVEDAAKAVAKCSRQPAGENGGIQVSAISHQQMVEDIQRNIEQKELDPELVASLGEPGTVISCHGFPPDVTIMDVAQFFDKFSLIESSVRIKLDDDGISTGECLLAVGTPQEAAKAVLLLSGRRLNGSTVTMSVVKPPAK